MICHPNQTAASIAVSERITEALAAQLKQPGTANLVLCGGNTPRQTIERLAAAPLDWSRVLISLTDERCVPRNHADSNARMVLDIISNTKAAEAVVIDLASPAFESLSRPAISVVGMGTDGHFASLFPDTEQLASALALDNPQRCVHTTTAASPHARISQTLAALVDTEQLLLLAFGEEKRSILHNPAELPVAALLQQTRTPVEIHWAP